MLAFEQLNVYSLANRNGPTPQRVHLFACEELKAELVVLPPSTTLEWQSYANRDELFDVLEGEGVFQIEDREFRGGPGKSVLVHAGVRHLLHNDGEKPWIVRSTLHERLSPRHIGRLIARAVRERLGMVG